MNDAAYSFFFDWDGGRVVRGNIEIKISGQEKILLKLLVENSGRVLGKEFLLNEIWEKRAPYVDELYLTQLIYRLRKSLRAVGLSEHIATVAREGYRFVPVPVVSAPPAALPQAPVVTRPRGLVGLLSRLGYAASRPAGPQAVSFVPADVRIDEETGVAWHRGAQAKLTRLEQRLLRVFLARPDTVLQKATLIQEVWGDEAPVDENCLTQLVSRLRRSLHPLGLDERVSAIPRVGYRFSTTAVAQQDTPPAQQPVQVRVRWGGLRLAASIGSLMAILLAFGAFTPSPSHSAAVRQMGGALMRHVTGEPQHWEASSQGAVSHYL